MYLGCKALKHVDVVAPLSEDLMRDMFKFGIKAHRIKFIENGLDLDEIHSLDAKVATLTVPRRSGEKWIGYVGQLIHRKNLSALLQTFDLLYQENQNIRLLIIGDGKLKEPLEKEAARQSSAGKIHFLGYRSDRLSIVRQLDLFCMTSSMEGIPRCMMEAMALGIPVAAFRIPGIDQLVIDGKTGLLAEFGDLKGLKEAWKKILFDPNAAKMLAGKGQERVLKKFSAVRMAHDYSALYHSMLEGRAAA
jgi:glycosyltransferase involved in cell wall biosynthesis